MPEPSFTETLYRILPALYRTRDRTGDLRAYLAGCGELLDGVYATLRQRYGDNYPDKPPDGAAIPPCQDWLLPYFAELLDTRLLSPLADGRRDELGRALRWRQGKGSLGVVESVVEGLGQTEAVVQEGWRRVAVTPRIGAPLVPARAFGYATDPLAANPGSAARHPDLPAVTVDFRCPSRAIATDQDNPGAQTITIDGSPLIWRQGSRHGAPCFPGSYQDVSRRTADLRTPDWARGQAHPRRILLYLPPPAGFFPPNQPTVAWSATPSAAYLDEIEVSEPTPDTRLHRAKRSGARVPVRVTGTVDLDAAVQLWRFEDIAFAGVVQSGAARVEFTRAAADTVRFTGSAPEIALTATDSLFREILAPDLRVQLVGVTVLGRCVARLIEASEALFLGRLARAAAPNALPPNSGCLRFSAIRADQPAGTMRLHAVTREAAATYSVTYGDRACGVLSPASHPSVLTGAEDEGEVGAFHHAMHARILAATREKLAEVLPVGHEAVLIPDPTLTETPFEFA
jgi:hypothetical protein